MKDVAKSLEILWRLHEAADPAWSVREENGGTVLVVAGELYPLGRGENARLAAEIRNALPLLLTYIRTLEEEVESRPSADRPQRRGIIRTVDHLGRIRIVIPKDIRRAIKIRPEDLVEVSNGQPGELVITKFAGNPKPIASLYAEILKENRATPLASPVAGRRRPTVTT